MAGRRHAGRRDVRAVLCHEPVPLADDYPKQQEINSAAGVALLDRSARRAADPFAVRRLRLADRRRAADLVKAIVAVEPNGPPVHETEFKGAPELVRRLRARKISGLGMCR